jgi:hypothetical protein
MKLYLAHGEDRVGRTFRALVVLAPDEPTARSLMAHEIPGFRVDEIALTCPEIGGQGGRRWAEFVKLTMPRRPRLNGVLKRRPADLAARELVTSYLLRKPKIAPTVEPGCRL